MKSQQPKTSRKMYWFNAHAPILFGKLQMSNNMRAMHIVPRYMHTSTENRGLMGNTQRTSLLHANNVLSSVTSMKYKMPDNFALSSTTTQLTPLVNDFQHNDKQNYTEYLRMTPSTSTTYLQNNDKPKRSEYNFKNDWTACPEHIISPTKPSADCFTGLSNNYHNDYPTSLEDNAVTITTTSLPYSNYITHTYFTLDDVIIPRTRTPFKYLPSQKTFTTESDPETRFIPTTEMTLDNFDIVNSDDGSESVEYTKQTMEPFIPIMETRIEEIKITTPIPEVTTDVELDLLEKPKPTTTNLTTPLSTLLYQAQDLSNSSKELCKNCRDNFTSVMSPTMGGLRLKSINDLRLKLKETYQNSLKMVNTHNATQKVNTTLVLPRTHISRNQKKYRILTSTKKTPVHTYPKVTEMVKPNTKRNKTSRMYIRRRIVETNSTVLDNSIRNISKEISTTKQPKQRPISINTRSPKKLDKEPSSSVKPKLATDGTTAEKVSVGTESAIMTISSGSPKQARRPILKFKQYQRNGNKLNSLDYDTVVPPLPIEVYFKKANQN
ncbi:uncharacterized protein Dwil_GK19384 [Drosophila willistoni]|nr:uncharacterized protein Dwil_GK19384 [Drosophila willistoni]